MTKRQMIVEQIVSINRSASAEFLDQFNQSDLETYLQHLQDLRQPKLMGNCRRYEKYFTKAVTPASQCVVQAIPVVQATPAKVAAPVQVEAPAETLFAAALPETVTAVKTVKEPAEESTPLLTVAEAPLVAQPVAAVEPEPVEPEAAPTIAEPVYAAAEEEMPQESADVFYDEIASYDAQIPTADEDVLATASAADSRMEMAGAPGARNSSKSSTSARKDDNESFLF